eukprot:scaffold827_cov76-Cylindrotheca_fusiformis.AAC.3
MLIEEEVEKGIIHEFDFMGLPIKGDDDSERRSGKFCYVLIDCCFAFELVLTCFRFGWSA